MNILTDISKSPSRAAMGPAANHTSSRRQTTLSRGAAHQSNGYSKKNPQPPRNRYLLESVGILIEKLTAQLRSVAARQPIIGDILTALDRNDLPPSQRLRLAMTNCRQSCRVIAIETGHYIARQFATPAPVVSSEMWTEARRFGLLTALLAQLIYLPLNWFAWAMHTMVNIMTMGWTHTDKANEFRRDALQWIILILLYPFGMIEWGLRLLFAKVIENLAATSDDEPVIGPIVSIIKRIGGWFGFKDR